MAKPFSIQDYLSKNTWKTGGVEKEVGDNPFKGGHNDIRKTNYDVNIVDGKLDLNTHRKVLTESKTQINEGNTKGVKSIGDCQKSKFELEVYECLKCGFHLGLDATYLEQDGDINSKCPGCNTSYTVAGFE